MEKERYQARYVYCIGQFNAEQTKQKTNQNWTGVNGSRVRTIKVGALRAVVHDCKPKPYATKNPEKAKKWIIEHQNVVDKLLQETAAVVPFTFDTIFKKEKQLVDFLKLNKEKLKEKLRKLEGKREFGVKILYDVAPAEEQTENEKIDQLKEIENVEKESRGKAYFLKRKFEREASAKQQNELKATFEEFYKKISVFGEIIVEKNREENEVANFSCLIPLENVEKLGRSLDEINNLKRFTVRFTGPWPPYSFAPRLFEENEKETRKSEK